MLANDESAEDRVRRRLRELRIDRGLTLEAVASRAGMDTSTLSRLESGRRRLALDHLPALAAALGVSSDELLLPHTPEDPRIRAEPVRRGDMTFWPLTRRGAAGGLHAFKFLIPHRRELGPADQRVHDGHDWIYVLSGRLRLLLGDDELILEPGEAVEFSCRTPHAMGAVEEPVEAIGIFGPHGERVHVHG
ncbi:helix-turn-helix domain-containing protein [Conexibacter sp. W3-3-2]|uniref:XRE family transcriptional regulator n=1 Tax=Paraconexibacter algicola TaxID=2133960 RepID=A0A2T4UG30_9ACTN|nr:MULTISPECIES: helix-turn-helix transcriptional regulator [Solirubrobacterales]MTD44453.1 helix-turn-helix domain-containing protein [Conexibacter sp. W3-3-2]PTL58214.1 XRE family transcriptional regulator [Paraconexibacter algicola]